MRGYGSPQGRSGQPGMLLIICYASWRVTRATRQRAAGEIETGATGGAFEIDEDSRGRGTRGGGKESRARERSPRRCAPIDRGRAARLRALTEGLPVHVSVL